VREVVVVSPERRIVFNDMEAVERIRVFEKGVKRASEEANVGQRELLLRDGDIISPALPASEPLRNECGHFLHCVRRGEPLYTPSSQGVAVVRVLEAIDRSMRSRGAPVPVTAPLEGARP
jgi:predicted dehydrogenase